MNSACLSRLHPTVATLSYLTATGRLRNEDRALSGELIDSPDWEELDGESQQFVLMVNGANLSEEARSAAIDYILDYIPEGCYDRSRLR